MKTNQCELILQYLNDFGSITTFESYTELGITRLPSRIFDLKQRGYKFEEEWVSKKNRYGKMISFKKYILQNN
jgi:hypothetical protein